MIEPETVKTTRKALGKFGATHEVWIEVNGRLHPINEVNWHSLEACVVIRAGKPVTTSKEKP